MQSRRCCLCSAKSPVTLHTFPKNVSVRNLWKQICFFEEYDDVSRLCICSNHFTPDDYIEPNAKSFGRRLKLKPGQFPTVNVPNSLLVAQHIIEKEIIKIIDIEHDYVTPSNKLLRGTLKLKNDLFPLVEVHNTLLFSHQFCEEEISTVEVETSPLEELFPNNSANQEVPKLQDNAALEIPRKRKFLEPRFVSEIEYSDLTTPKKVKIALNLATNEIKKLETKTNELQFKNRRLAKQLSLFEKMLKHVIETKTIPQDAIDTIMDILPLYVRKHILGNSKSKKKRK